MCWKACTLWFSVVGVFLNTPTTENQRHVKSMCLVWVFSLGVLPALFHFVSLLFRDVARRADF